MKKTITLAALSTALIFVQGCTHTVESSSDGRHAGYSLNLPLPIPTIEHLKKGDSYESADHGWHLPQQPPGVYLSHKTIDDYAEQLAMQLVENLNYAKQTNTVAVTSFVELDSSLNKTNLIGNHLADSLMGELQEFGVAVIDYKLRDSIVVNRDGDFSMTRNHTALKEWHDIDYVLTGTMTRSYRGILIHARMVGMKSKVVVSSAKILLPTRVLNSIYYSNTIDGIYYGD